MRRRVLFSLRRPWSAFCLAGLLVSLACSALAAEEQRAIAVIVPAQSALATEVHANELGLIFWRKKLYGPHGQVLHPANLHSEHPLRQRFSETVLHSSPLSQVAYWNGLYFHGVQPPFTVQSEEAMLRYIADTEHAIGYVDACHVDERVKAVLWIWSGKILSEPPALRCDAGI